MITDNAGLDTNSDKAADKNKVSEVLNAMAGKLQYTGYQNGERNLKGKLRIAEGLTSSSAGLKTEALSFKRDGRGYFSELVRKGVCGQEPTAAGLVMTPTMRI